MIEHSEFYGISNHAVEELPDGNVLFTYKAEPEFLKTVFDAVEHCNESALVVLGRSFVKSMKISLKALEESKEKDG